MASDANAIELNEFKAHPPVDSPHTAATASSSPSLPAPRPMRIHVLPSATDDGAGRDNDQNTLRSTNRSPKLSPAVTSPRMLKRSSNVSSSTGSTRNLFARQLPSYTLRVDQPWRHVWNAFRLLIILFYAIICPLRLVFSPRDEWTPTMVIDYFLADVFMFFNLLANCYVFVPAFMQEGERAQITKLYLSGKSSSKLLVAIDLIATLPWDLLGYFSLLRGTGYATVYALRMAKVLHVTSVFQIVEQLPSQMPSLSELSCRSKPNDAETSMAMPSTARAMFGLESMIMSIGHNKASMAEFGLLTKRSAATAHETIVRDTSKGLTMSALRNLGLKPIYKIVATYLLLIHIYACLWSLLTVTSRLNSNFDAELNQGGRYMESLYFVVVCMACVGYGDITPSNLNEVALTMLMELSGFLCIGGLIAYTVPLFAQAQQASTASQNSFTAWIELFEDNAIPQEVRERILDYYRYMDKRQQGAVEEQLLADEHLIPARYRVEIGYQIIGPALLTLPFLCTPLDAATANPAASTTNSPPSPSSAAKGIFSAPMGLVRAMIAKMHTCTYCVGDIILFCGQRNESLHIIANGHVAVVTLQEGESEGEVVEISAELKTKYFGVESFLHPEVLVQADYQVLDTSANINGATAAGTQSLSHDKQKMGKGGSTRNLNASRTGGHGRAAHSHPYFAGSSTHSSFCDVFTLTRSDYVVLSRPYPNYALELLAARDPNFNAELYAAERAALDARKQAALALAAQQKVAQNATALAPAEEAASTEKEARRQRVNSFMGSNPLAAVGLSVQQELVKGEFQDMLSPTERAMVAANQALEDATQAAQNPHHQKRISISTASKVLVVGHTAGHRRRRNSSINDAAGGHLKKALADREKLLAGVVEDAETDDSDSDEVPSPPKQQDNQSTDSTPTASLSHAPRQPSWLWLLLTDPATLIHHSSLFRRCWDFLLLLLVLYTILLVPIQTAFYNVQLDLVQYNIPFSVVLASKRSKSSTSLIEYIRTQPVGQHASRTLSDSEWALLCVSWLIDLVFMCTILLRVKRFLPAVGAEARKTSVQTDELAEDDGQQKQSTPQRPRSARAAKRAAAAAVAGLNSKKGAVADEQQQEAETGDAALRRTLLDHAKRFGAHYRSSYKFVVDVCAEIPLEVIILFGVSSEWLYFFRLNRLLRFHRIRELQNRFEFELQERFSRGLGWIGKYLSLIKILFYAVLFCHFVGCCWFLLSYLLTWQGYNDTWIWADGLINEPLAKRYVRSFFFALVTCATIGFGGIVPRCTGEYIFVIILVIIGVSMYVTLLASLTVSAENRHAATHASEQFQQILRQYFRTRNVDATIREKCLQYYSTQGNSLLKCQKEDALINALPPLLKIELLAPLMASAFFQLPLFSELSDEFLDMLLCQLEARTFAPGDVISIVGERSDEVFFIHRGLVDQKVVIAGHLRTIKTLQPEESFGSECFLYSSPPERPATFTAQAICTVFVLTKKKFDVQLAVFPDDYDQITAKRSHLQSQFESFTATNAPSETRRDSIRLPHGPSHQSNKSLWNHPSKVIEAEHENSHLSRVAQSQQHSASSSSDSSSSSSDSDDDGNVRNGSHAVQRGHQREVSQSGVSMTRLMGGKRAPSFENPSVINVNGRSSMDGSHPMLQSAGEAFRSPRGHNRSSSHSALVAGALSAIMKSKGLDDGNAAGSPPTVSPHGAVAETEPVTKTPSFNLSAVPPPPEQPPSIPAPTDNAGEDESKDNDVEEAEEEVAPIVVQSPVTFEKGKLRKLSTMRMERSGTFARRSSQGEYTTGDAATGKVADSMQSPSLASQASFRSAEEAVSSSDPPMEQDPAAILAMNTSPTNANSGGGNLMRMNTHHRAPSFKMTSSNNSQPQRVQSFQRSPSMKKQESLSRTESFGKHREITVAEEPTSPTGVLRTVSFSKGQSSANLPRVSSFGKDSLARTPSFKAGVVPTPTAASTSGGLIRSPSNHGTALGGSNVARGGSLLANGSDAFVTAAKGGKNAPARTSTIRGGGSATATGPTINTATELNAESAEVRSAATAAADVNVRLLRHQAAAARMGTWNNNMSSQPVLPADAVTEAPVKRVITRTGTFAADTANPSSPTSGTGITTSPKGPAGRTSSLLARRTASRVGTSHRSPTSHGTRRLGTHTRPMNATYTVNGAKRTLTRGFLRTESLATLATDSGEELSLRFIPHSLFRNIWSFIGGIGILWFCFVVPYRICFESPFRHSWSPVVAAAIVNEDGSPTNLAGTLFQDPGDWMQSTEWSLHPTIWIDCIFDIFFIIDIYLHFNYFAYYENGVLVSHPPAKLRQHYIRTSLWLDIIGTFIFDFAILAFNNQQAVWILYWLRLLRLVRLHRIEHHLEVIYYFLDNYSFLGLVKINISLINIALQWVLIAIVFNALGCVWYLVGVIDNSAESWLSQRESPVYAMNSRDDPHLPKTYLYIECLYFIVCTMSTVGFGDIQPHTILETWFVVVTIFLGLVIYASVTANIASLAANMDVAIGSFQRDFDNAKSFIVRKNLPTDLKRKINMYYRNLWVEFKGKSEMEILQTLPVLLREDINYSLHSDLIMNCGLFSGPAASNANTSTSASASTTANEGLFKLPFLRRVASLLVYRSYVDGEAVFKKGEYIDFAILVKSGCFDAFEQKPVNLNQTPAVNGDQADTGSNPSSPIFVDTTAANAAAFKESLVHRYTKNMVVNPESLMVLPSSKSKKDKHRRKAAAAGEAPPAKLTLAEMDKLPLAQPLPVKQSRTIRAYQNVVGLVLYSADLHELLLTYPQLQSIVRKNIVGMKNSKTGLLRQGNTLSLMADAKKAALAKQKKKEAAAAKKGAKASKRATVKPLTDAERAEKLARGESVIDVPAEEGSDSSNESDEGDDVDSDELEASEKTKEKREWIVLRESSFRLKWDLFALCFVILYLVSIPILVAFSSSNKDEFPWSHGFWSDAFWPILVITAIFDIFFGFDFYLHLRRFAPSKEIMAADSVVGSSTTSAISDGEEEGEEVEEELALKLKPNDITHQYLFKRKYGLILAVIESISGFPWDLVALLISAGTHSPILTLQVISVLRLGRLLYIARLSTYLESFDLFIDQAKLNINFQLQRILKLSIMIVVVLHWMACGWYLLGKYPYAGVSLEDVNPTQNVNAEFGSGNPDVSWLNYGYKADVISSATDFGHYVFALYWAISTITTTGFGDITSTNCGEMLLNIFMILGGDIVYGAIIGGICVNAANAHAPIAYTRGKMTGLLAYLKYRHVSSPLQARILLYHKHLWDHTQGLDVYDERIIQRELPSKLSKEARYFIHSHLLKSIPFFEGCSTLFLSHVACLLKERTFLRGESVYRQGDLGESLYLLKSGEMRVSLRKGTAAAVGVSNNAISQHDLKHIQLEAPCLFGEVSFFLGTSRSAHVIALTTCLVLELNRAEFEEQLKFFPNYRKQIMERFVTSIYPDIKTRLKVKKSTDEEAPITHEVKIASKILRKHEEEEERSRSGKEQPKKMHDGTDKKQKKRKVGSASDDESEDGGSDSDVSSNYSSMSLDSGLSDQGDVPNAFRAPPPSLLSRAPENSNIDPPSFVPESALMARTRAIVKQRSTEELDEEDDDGEDREMRLGAMLAENIDEVQSPSSDDAEPLEATTTSPSMPSNPDSKHGDDDPSPVVSPLVQARNTSMFPAPLAVPIVEEDSETSEMSSLASRPPAQVTSPMSDSSVENFSPRHATLPLMPIEGTSSSSSMGATSSTSPTLAPFIPASTDTTSASSSEMPPNLRRASTASRKVTIVRKASVSTPSATTPASPQPTPASPAVSNTNVTSPGSPYRPLVYTLRPGRGSMQISGGSTPDAPSPPLQALNAPQADESRRTSQ